jgi:S1-C subfamily serine protease
MLRVIPLRAIVLGATLITFALALESAALAQQVSAGQRMAMYSKPAVVRVYDGYRGKFYWPKNNRVYTVSTIGKGSGFFINPNGYIATNAHVTESTREGVTNGKRELFMQFVGALARDYGLDPRQARNNPQIVDSVARQAGTEPREFQHFHHVVIPDGSVFPFEIKSYGAPVGQGKDVSIIKIEVKNAPILRLGDSDKVQLQDHITVFGYPAAADTSQSETLDAKSALEASITDGKVSAKKNAADGAPVLQVSAPATHGNSGGPVLNDRGEVVGLLTFRGDTVRGQEVSGFAFVVPSSTMLEFVKQAGIANEPGLADRRYREGLELYWQGYYSRAITKFEEVKRLFPQHSETERLIRDSQQAIAEGKERGLGFFGWFMILAVVGGGFILLLGGVVVIIIFTPQGKRLRASLRSAFSAPPAQATDQAGLTPPVQAWPQAQPVVPGPVQPPAPEGARISVSGAEPQRASVAPATNQTVPVSSPSAKTEALSLGMIAFTTGALAGQRFKIPAEGFYIGRDDSLAQVVLADSRVSKRHLWIGVQQGRVMAVDQGSTNGTFLNTPDSERVTAVPLNPGDTIFLAGSEICFTFQPPAAQGHLRLVNPSAA